MNDQVILQIPAKPQYISIVRLTASSLASALDFDVEIMEDICVCVSEACNNVMENRSTMNLRFTSKENSLSIEVEGFTEPKNEQSKMGLLIIQSLMDVVVRMPEGIFMEKAKETYE